MIKNHNMVKKVHYSVKKACEEVPHKDYARVNAALMEIFGCSTKQYFYEKRKDFVNMPAHIIDKVKSLFTSLGFKEENIFEIWEEE